MPADPFFTAVYASAVQPKPFILAMREYGGMTDSELAEHDVAKYHFACTEGFLDEPTETQKAECISRLDHYARCVDHFTRREMPKFLKQPGNWNYFEGLFRMDCLVRLVQTQFGVRYNPDKIPETARFDAADSFIHGALLGAGGTCASLPVVYTAVARRLGYPVRLVSTKRHLFCRWDSEQIQRFNIEVYQTGFAIHEDDHYRQGRYEFDPLLESQTTYLKSMTPRHELGYFISQRAWRWLELNNYQQALDSFLWASMLLHGDKLVESYVVTVINRYLKRLRERTPPNFPRIAVQYPAKRRWPLIPAKVEHDAISLEIWEHLLNDSQFNEKCVQPLWANPHKRPADIPESVFVTAYK
jgi:hypothetical protein